MIDWFCFLDGGAVSSRQSPSLRCGNRTIYLVKLSDFALNLFPQRHRFEHFGFGSEAQHPGFDFFGGGELELGDGVMKVQGHFDVF